MNQRTPTQETTEIDVWMRRAKQLPPVPAVAEKALALLDDANSTTSDVARIIAQDEAMTAKILQLVNSAFFGLSKPVSTLSRAVVYLGYEQIRLIVVGVAFSMLGKSASPAAVACREKVWEHAVSCAGWAQAVARRVRYPVPEEAFIAGLLHDAGKIVLAVSEPEQFEAALAMMRETGVDSIAAERATLGIDHVAIGKVLAERWRFPTSLVTCITMHHAPWSSCLAGSLAREPKLVQLLAVVRVANAASHARPDAHATNHNGANESVPNLDPGVVDLLADEVSGLARQTAIR